MHLLTDLIVLRFRQDYEYHVYENNVIVKDPTAVIFEGTWKQFAQFCLDPISAE